MDREAAERIQDLYLAQRKEEAPAAVPDEWVDAKSLVGPRARILQRYRAWEDCGLTGLTVRCKQPGGHRGDGRGGPRRLRGQYGLVLPLAGFAGAPERISCTAAWPPIVIKRLSPPTVTKVKPISIIFLA